MPLPPVRVANIGMRERRQRYVMGLAILVVSAGLLGRSEVSRWWRLGLMVPLWASMLGLVQAREQTCVVLAARGACRLPGQAAYLNRPEIVDLALSSGGQIRTFWGSRSWHMGSGRYAVC